MIIRIHFFFLGVLLNIPLLAQYKLNCDSIFSKDSLYYTKYISGVYYESGPTPYGSFKVFYENLRDKVSNIDEKGKVFVRFVVDTVGRGRCMQVVKSDNEKLNVRALEIIEETKFSPATQRNKKVVAPMVLPITFGEPPKKKKGKQ